ncbi:hypothetical protein [Candidatus Nitrosocosmicus sp. R]
MDEFYLIYTSMIKALQARGGYLYGIRKISYTNAPSHVIFIGELYPTLEKDIPADIDSTNNTVQNYLFHDKSKI